MDKREYIKVHKEIRAQLRKYFKCTITTKNMLIEFIEMKLDYNQNVDLLIQYYEYRYKETY
jgi:hypothetical protein